MALILLNARASSRPELGGVERWGREVIARLVDIDPELYRVVRPPAALVHRAGHAWEQAVLPVLAARLRATLLFSPANLAPIAWPRNVVVIHDAAALREAAWYSRSYVAWQRLVMPRIARRAAHVVTVSEFSRRELIDLLGVSPERVSVIAGGVDERFRPDADAPAAAAALQVSGPYVLAVGSATARKNFAALELAARRLRARGIALVAAGGSRPQFRAEDEEDAASVRQLGYVPDHLLPGLYAGARALVLPSLYEGFGLVCLEAMAAGVPVVASNRGALPETCGDAALLVEPTDQEAIAAALEQVLDDEALRTRLRAAGLARAAELTWDRTASETHALLTRIG